ncbi:ferric reductase transmembrane component 2 [Colletotrichum truncatum]|uniref:Ferric reductase transmembrane component 2 n=1 Tax=Colletotrichum truncatum TaxID=5467 RepID=A0ACC3YVV1_COLTU|nr:ferric reductase transmembrane component 2 [Colletotrichum truncatum]KAF6791221.1 ferric reductase transmembrane component 2 [Colletotrichum truncatum]
MDTSSHLVARQGYQSQNISEGSLVNYWGYAARVLPCTNDPGTCEYFEVVYGSHAVGMTYTGILWATIGGILLILAIGRHLWASPRAAETIPGVVDDEKSSAAASSTTRFTRAVAALRRQHLLPDSVRFIFGRTTRLQVLILVILTGYLTLWSFLGIHYQTWRTPVKAYPGVYQTRSSLGAWSDRVGVLAYALTPFSIMLANRESILSALTGIPYQNFNFLHRWLGYIIFVQSLAHTIGWTIIETAMYQPQPQVANKWIKQLYMIWGCVAMILILILVVLSTPWGIRLTGYEFFRKSHYVLAMVYIGACWGHWQPLKVFMVPGLALWLFDRLARLVRSALMHYQFLPDGKMGFKAAHADLTVFPDAENGDIVRLDFSHAQSPWSPGQHFYLCFSECSIWQSHPFTPLSLPVERNGTVQHAYVFRAKKGETKKVAELATKKLSLKDGAAKTTPVILSGSYGESLVEDLHPEVNVLCVAGGTGIAYVLPVLLHLASQPAAPERKIELIWAVRCRHDIAWVQPELDVLLAAAKTHGIQIQVHVTRNNDSAKPEVIVAGDEKRVAESSSASSLQSTSLDVQSAGVHPDLNVVVPGFVEGTVRGRSIVYASGPGSMISQLRSVVASCNSGGRVWKGDARYDVELKCDDRLEW